MKLKQKPPLDKILLGVRTLAENKVIKVDNHIQAFPLKQVLLGVIRTSASKFSQLTDGKVICREVVRAAKKCSLTYEKDKCWQVSEDSKLEADRKVRVIRVPGKVIVPQGVPKI